MQTLKFFAPDENPCVSEMTCSICLNVWMDPVEIRPCCHTYCTSCLGSLKECPECRRTISETGKPNRILTNMLHLLVGTCFRCGWKGTHGEYCHSHSKENCVAQPAVASSRSSAHNSITTRQGLGSSASNRTGHTDPTTSATAALQSSNGAGFVPSGDNANFPALERQQSGFVVGGKVGDLTSVTEDGIPTCMLFPILPEANDINGNNTGLEQKEGTSSVVMISTATKPWREYNLTKEQYIDFQLAFFAFADVVPANEAPFPQMAADDRDRNDNSTSTAQRSLGQSSTARASPSSLNRRTIMLLRPEAVKRCLWWLNVPAIEHDAIVDDLFPSFDIHLPLTHDKASRVNDDKVQRPAEGPLAPPIGHENDESAKYIVYGVTMHQFMNWLGWNSDKLSPPLSEYGLSKEHYDAVIQSARTLDIDQTGAFDPDTVATLIKSVVEIRKTVGVKAPVSLRTAEVNKIMANRRFEATQAASSRESTKLTLVGPRYPPGEYLLHDILIACKHAEVGPDWDDIDDDEAHHVSGKARTTQAPPPSVVASSRASMAVPAATASTFSSSSGSQATNNNRAPAATPPPKKAGFFEKLFGPKKEDNTTAGSNTAAASSIQSNRVASPPSQAASSRSNASPIAQPAATAPSFNQPPPQNQQAGQYRPPQQQQPQQQPMPNQPMPNQQPQQFQPAYQPAGYPAQQQQQQQGYHRPLQAAPQNPGYVQQAYQQPVYQQPQYYAQPGYVQPMTTQQWAVNQANAVMNAINPQGRYQAGAIPPPQPQQQQGFQYYNQYPQQQQQPAYPPQPSYPTVPPGYRPKY